jgi:hypothetical protein
MMQSLTVKSESVIKRINHYGYKWKIQVPYLPKVQLEVRETTEALALYSLKIRYLEVAFPG